MKQTLAGLVPEASEQKLKGLASSHRTIAYSSNPLSFYYRSMGDFEAGSDKIQIPASKSHDHDHISSLSS
jgi:hypothetical protein